MDNWEGMVNQGHKIKYYLKAQYAVTQMTFLQKQQIAEQQYQPQRKMNDVHPFYV